MTANDIYRRHQVPNGAQQFYATVMVLGYLSAHYHNAAAHQQRVLTILAARQKS